MNNIPLWVQVLIAILGSGTIGGIAGAISSSFASRQKIRELEVAYLQKQADSFRINLSQHIQTLYIPVNIACSNLANKFNYYKWNISKNEEKLKIEFINECNKYIEQMLDIYDQGMDVYLTRKVDGKLQPFTFFLRKSLDCSEELKARNFIKTFFNKIRGKRLPKCTPISSLEFERIFRDELGDLKDYISEVVLGTVSIK